VSAFDATGFEDALRDDAIDAFLIGGIATHAGVEATVRDGAEKGYRVVVVRECCGGLTAEAHENSLDNVFPPIAEVIDLGDVPGMVGRS
jgi:nicotinamidase-related amidase